MHITGNTADLILAQLAEWGVERIYGVLGDAIFPLLDAVGRQHKIKFIAATHEANAAFMASYEARVTGKIAVCTATGGPGAVNLLNGLADAFMDGSPVLALTGQVGKKEIGLNVKQYFDQQGLFRIFSKNTSILVEPVSAVNLLVRAVRKACLERSVVHISIPKDVFGQAVSAEIVPPGFVEVKSTPVFSGDREVLADVIRSSQKPLILAGRFARDSVEQVAALAYRIGAGLITAQGAKGIIGGHQEIYLGGIGEAYLPKIVMEADCIVLIGDTSYEKNFLPREAKIVYINERPENIPANAAAYATGDPGLVVEDLVSGLGKDFLNQEWFGRVKDEVRAAKLLLTQEIDTMRPIHPLKLMTALSRVIPENSVITMDTGEFMHWFDAGFYGPKVNVLFSEKWRSIGCGLPAAVGAKFACPEKDVITIVGDGGFITSMSELLTCVRYNLAITIVLVKNGIYSIEKNKMVAEGLQPFGCEVYNPDFVQFAKSCGAEGFRIEDPAEIEKTVRFALELKKPVLLEVVCAAVDLPHANAPGK